MKEIWRLDFGGDIIFVFIEYGYEVYGYLMEGYWFDVGMFERYFNVVMYLFCYFLFEDMEVVEIIYDVYM